MMEPLEPIPPRPVDLDFQIFSRVYRKEWESDFQKCVAPDSNKSIIVIPARMASERLPGKPLLMAGGKALVHWTYDQAKKTKADHVVVATPDREIGRYCNENGLTWFPTAEDHPNGTSRCWEIVSRSKMEFKTIVNWQVDEPLIDPKDVDDVMTNTNCGAIVTLVYSDCSIAQLADSNMTKVVFSNGKCHWFSRAMMRGAGGHIGVYSFGYAIFSEVAQTPMSQMAEEESLEQLSWIEYGYEISPWMIGNVPPSINTQTDWDEFKKMKEEVSKC